MPGEQEGKDFFISRAGADKDWAAWIGYVLEEEGYRVHLQDWDFRPGKSFVRSMQEGATLCQRTLAVLSPDYVTGPFSAMEWEAALTRDPTGADHVLVTVRVRECEPPGLLARYPYIDLMGLDEATARSTLIEGVREGRAKPTKRPPFPSGSPPSVPPPFPAPRPAASPGGLPGFGLCIGRVLHRGALPGVSSVGSEVVAPAPERSPWAWTDIVLSMPLSLALATAVALAVLGPLVPLIHQLDPGLRTAVAGLVSQSALYAGTVAAVVGLVRLRHHVSLRTLGWAPVPARWLLSALPLAVAAYLVVIITSAVTHALFPHAQNSQPTLIRGAFGHYLVLAVVAFSVVAPFAEETYFRGFLFGWLRGRVPLWLAVVISSLLFTMAHAELALLLPTFTLGCLLALVYQRSGSLYPGMIIHAVFNLVGVTLILTTPLKLA